MSKSLPFCELGHNYQLNNEDTTRKTGKDGKTEIWKTLYCTKCGDTIQKCMAVWEPKVKQDSKPF